MTPHLNLFPQGLKIQMSKFVMFRVLTQLQLLTYVFVPRDIQSWFSSIFSRTMYATKTYNTSFESPDNGQLNT